MTIELVALEKVLSFLLTRGFDAGRKKKTHFPKSRKEIAKTAYCLEAGDCHGCLTRE